MVLTGTVHTHGAQMKDRHKEMGLRSGDWMVSSRMRTEGGALTVPLQIPAATLMHASGGQIAVEVLTVDGQVHWVLCYNRGEQWKSPHSNAEQPLRFRFVLNPR